MQGDPAFRASRPGQGGVAAVRPGQRDLPVGGLEVHLGDAGPAGLASLYVEAEPLPQPGRDQVRARVTRLGQDLTAEQSGVGLVQSGREQRAPGRRPGPAQVGVTRLVRLGQGQQHFLGRLAGGRVGHPPLGHRAERVPARRGRCLVRPPGDHGHVGREQRRDHRIGVLAERPVHAQEDGLPGAGLAHPDLGVEPRFALGPAGDDGQDPARMLAAGLAGRPDRVVLLGLVGDDDQREHRAGGGTAHPAAGLGQRLVDRGGAGVGQVDGHRSLPRAGAMLGYPVPSARRPTGVRPCPPGTGPA